MDDVDEYIQPILKLFNLHIKQIIDKLKQNSLK